LRGNLGKRDLPILTISVNKNGVYKRHGGPSGPWGPRVDSPAPAGQEPAAWRPAARDPPHVHRTGPPAAPRDSALIRTAQLPGKFSRPRRPGRCTDAAAASMELIRFISTIHTEPAPAPGGGGQGPSAWCDQCRCRNTLWSCRPAAPVLDDVP
jgi:hypothetical protein